MLMPYFETFIQATYGVDAIPHFDHTEIEVNLTRFHVFERRVNTKFATKIGCCDEDLQVIAGEITLIEKAAYTIKPEKGE